jgi:hypothetical protein
MEVSEQDAQRQVHQVIQRGGFLKLRRQEMIVQKTIPVYEVL